MLSIAAFFVSAIAAILFAVSGIWNPETVSTMESLL